MTIHQLTADQQKELEFTFSSVLHQYGANGIQYLNRRLSQQQEGYKLNRGEEREVEEIFLLRKEEVKHRIIQEEINSQDTHICFTCFEWEKRDSEINAKTFRALKEEGFDCLMLPLDHSPIKEGVLDEEQIEAMRDACIKYLDDKFNNHF